MTLILDRRPHSLSRSSASSSTSSTALVSVDTVDTNNGQTSPDIERKIPIDFQSDFDKKLESVMKLREYDFAKH